MIRLRWCALLCVAATACSDSAGPRSAAIRVISGAPGTDTILASTASLFTVEVVDRSGSPVSGASVHFTTQASAVDSTGVRKTLYACNPQLHACAGPAGDGGFGVYYGGFTATTDDRGRASATVQYGIVAGAGALQVSVPEMGDSITIRCTTRPGSLTQIMVSPRDTALYVGASYAFSVHSADLFGNARTDVVSSRVITPGIIALSRGRVTAVGLGRGIIVMASGGVRDTAFVSVPPPGRLVTMGWPPDFSTLTELTLVNTDGTDRRVILHDQGNDGTASPSWTLTGDGVLFESFQLPGRSLVITDTLGTNQRFVIDTAVFHDAFQIAVAAHTGLLYFYSPSNSLALSGIFRSNADGSGAAYLFSGVQPAPSPDGSHVAYIEPGSDGVLDVRDLNTGHVITIATGAARPKWSPTGEKVAFAGDLETDIHVVSADGTASRIFATDGAEGVSWSPDAQWLVVSGALAGLKLIRVSDGEVLPIPGTSTLLEPAWRP